LSSKRKGKGKRDDRAIQALKKFLGILGQKGLGNGGILFYPPRNAC